jgi:DNA-binding MltR family transcriptional regulator
MHNKGYDPPENPAGQTQARYVIGDKMTGHLKKEVYIKKLSDFLIQYVDEKDRIAVILVAAKLDYLLGQAIAAKLLPCTATTDELLDNDRALGTFSARIHAAYRLGIIDESFAKAVHIFRRIRNDFAHSYHDTSFSDGHHRDRLHELVRPLIGGDYYNLMRTITQKYKLSEERINFIIASSFLIGSLEFAPDKVESISASAALSFSE